MACEVQPPLQVVCQDSALSQPFCAVAVSGLAIYGWEMRAILRARKRRTLDWGLKYFLTAIALLPVWIADVINVPFRFGGTSLLIVVGVALDTMAQMQQHLLLRKYDGFMKKGRVRFRGRQATGGF